MGSTLFKVGPLALLLVTLGCLWFDVGAEQVYKMQQSVEADGGKDEDVGRLNSCLDVPQPFLFQWKPRVLRPQTTFLFNFSVVMAEEFKSGNACITIWLKGIDDPIYKDCGGVMCDKVAAYIQKFDPKFQCPVQKGYVLKKILPYKLDPSIPLPAGDYRVRGEIKNDKQKQILCLEGDVSAEDQ